MRRHRCKHPAWHQLGMVGAVLLWLYFGACIGVPLLVYALTGSAPWGLASAGLALTVGSVVVYQVAAWRCRGRQPRPQTRWALPSAAAVLGFHHQR